MGQRLEPETSGSSRNRLELVVLAAKMPRGTPLFLGEGKAGRGTLRISNKWALGTGNP